MGLLDLEMLLGNFKHQGSLLILTRMFLLFLGRGPLFGNFIGIQQQIGNGNIPNFL